MTLLLTPAARSYDDLGGGGRMKLLLCPECYDIRRMRQEEKVVCESGLYGLIRDNPGLFGGSSGKTR